MQKENNYLSEIEAQVHYYANKYHWLQEKEDLKQELRLTAFSALQTYDETRGIKISTLIAHAIRHKIFELLHKQFEPFLPCSSCRKKHTCKKQYCKRVFRFLKSKESKNGLKHPISIYKSIKTDDGEGGFLYEILSKRETFPEAIKFVYLLMEWAEESLPSDLYQIIQMMYEGYTQQDIAKAQGLDQSVISRKLEQIRKIIRRDLKYLLPKNLK